VWRTPKKPGCAAPKKRLRGYTEGTEISLPRSGFLEPRDAADSRTSLSILESRFHEPLIANVLANH
jgi:hypothetical protein